MYRYYERRNGQEFWTTTITDHKVFAMFAAVEHNYIAHMTSVSYDEYTFSTEDDLVAFEEELAAYDGQQQFLEGLDDNELTALCIR